MGFFELCVHECTRISDWLRLLKRQSNVNRYLSSFPGEKVCFHTQIRKMEKEKKYIEEALDSRNIRRESMKLILKEEQERAIKEFDFGVN